VKSTYREIRHLCMRTRTLAILGALVLLGGMAIPGQAQTYTPIYSFGVLDSTQNGPYGQLALGRDGNFYGEVNPVRSEIYRIAPDGDETLLWMSPQSPNPQQQCVNGLTLGVDGVLYGTCNLWDDNKDNGGVIFKYDPAQGQAGPSVLYKFPYCNYSTYGLGPLTLGTDGNLYGTTTGNAGCPGNYTYGTFFQITPAGKFTILHIFQGANANEPGTPTGRLALGADGNFYGTSQIGGHPQDYNGGTVYKITPKGKVTLLYSFPNTGPYEPMGSVTQGADGKFYGTTYYGGTSGHGTIFQLVKAGTIKVLHNFNYHVDNAGFPAYPLTLGSDGSFYSPSLTFNMGGYGPESLFKITTKGVYTDLYNLQAAACAQGTEDGCYLSSPMVQHPNGNFYGTNAQGGEVGRGMFYGLNTGLRPYIVLQFPRGKRGASIGIFGAGLTGATAVSFNGVAANFTVMSDTYMTATIPASAIKGYVTVTTPSGTLKSAVKLTVTK
jgi:uncharacterized repeat protein (TIGR03803 family)